MLYEEAMLIVCDALKVVFEIKNKGGLPFLDGVVKALEGDRPLSEKQDAWLERNIGWHAIDVPDYDDGPDDEPRAEPEFMEVDPNEEPLDRAGPPTARTTPEVSAALETLRDKVQDKPVPTAEEMTISKLVGRLEIAIERLSDMNVQHTYELEAIIEALKGN